MKYRYFKATKNHRHGTRAGCEDSDCSTDWTKDVSNESVTPNREPQKKLQIVLVKGTCIIGCLYITLFVPNLIIQLQFDILPSTKFLLFPHTCLYCNETPTESQVKLIMKMSLLAIWYHYVSNLMSCFNWFIICFCLSLSLSLLRTNKWSNVTLLLHYTLNHHIKLVIQTSSRNIH